MHTRLCFSLILAVTMTLLAGAQSLPDLVEWGQLSDTDQIVRVPAKALPRGASLVVYGDGTFQTRIQVVLGGYTITTDLAVINEESKSFKHFLDEHYALLSKDNAADEYITVKLWQRLPEGANVGVYTTMTNKAGPLSEWMLERYRVAKAKQAPAQSTKRAATVSAGADYQNKSSSPVTSSIVQDGTLKNWPVYRIVNPVITPGSATRLVLGSIESDGSGYGNIQPKRGETRNNVTDVREAPGGRGLILEIDQAWGDAVIEAKVLEGRIASFMVWGETEDGSIIPLKSGTRTSYSLGELLPPDGPRIRTLIPVINLTVGSARMGGAAFTPLRAKAVIHFILR